MNTVTRAIESQALKYETKASAVSISKRGTIILFLILILLATAFGVIYMKDLNRRLFIQLQTLERQKAQDVVQWGKLLLEQSTLSTQSRIQQIAQRQLEMDVPSEGSIIMVEDRNENETIR